jgi:putative Ca2+/H+ antiporter (TMEM165/GDT1 family)
MMELVALVDLVLVLEFFHRLRDKNIFVAACKIVMHLRACEQIIFTSFVVIFAAEWGDLTQIFAAAQTAKTGQPFTVFIGAWLGLITVAGLAVVLGRWLQKRIPLSRVRIASGIVLLILAVWTAIEFIQVL